jgi:hypothetical protein
VLRKHIGRLVSPPDPDVREYLLAFRPQQFCLIQAIVDRFMHRSEGLPEISGHLFGGAGLRSKSSPIEGFCMNTASSDEELAVVRPSTRCEKLLSRL